MGTGHTNDTHETSGVRPAPKGLAEHLRRDTAPLDRKINAAVIAAMTAGLLIGTIEAATGFQVWPGALLAVGAAALLTKGARCWIADPFHRLIRLLPSITRDQERRPLSHLPTHREDEVGNLANLIHGLTGERISQRHESRRLRRTLDSRVQEATRRATSELKNQAFRDPLTGAGNRRHLDEQLPELVSAARASETELVVIALDMDFFKQVNDQLGHAAGDDLLTLLTDLLTGSVRDDDVVIRLGGDEFVVLQPAGDIRQAQQFAHRLRRLYLHQTRQVAAALEDDVVPSISIGIAGLQADGLASGAALLSKADERVYTAKRAGRGRTASPLGLSDAA